GSLKPSPGPSRLMMVMVAACAQEKKSDSDHSTITTIARLRSSVVVGTRRVARPRMRSMSARMLALLERRRSRRLAAGPIRRRATGDAAKARTTARSHARRDELAHPGVDVEAPRAVGVPNRRRPRPKNASLARREQPCQLLGLRHHQHSGLGIDADHEPTGGWPRQHDLLMAGRGGAPGRAAPGAPR